MSMASPHGHSSLVAITSPINIFEDGKLANVYVLYQ